MSTDAPRIASSARKHSVHDDDMTHAFNNPIRVDDLDDGFTIFIGPSSAGNILEIGVVDSDAGPIIIHAMDARSKYLR